MHNAISSLPSGMKTSLVGLLVFVVVAALRVRRRFSASCYSPSSLWGREDRVLYYLRASVIYRYTFSVHLNLPNFQRSESTRREKRPWSVDIPGQDRSHWNVRKIREYEERSVTKREGKSDGSTFVRWIIQSRNGERIRIFHILTVKEPRFRQVEKENGEIWFYSFLEQTDRRS